MNEAEALVPVKLGNTTLNFQCFPSMTDHKTKSFWSTIDEAGIAHGSCYGCTANWREMKNRSHPKFEDLKESAKKLCFANLHVKTCTFKWLKKGCTYR